MGHFLFTCSDTFPVGCSYTTMHSITDGSSTGTIGQKRWIAYCTSHRYSLLEFIQSNLRMSTLVKQWRQFPN